MRFQFRRRVTPAALRPVTVPANPAGLFATPAPAPLISRYLVLYNRVGDWGRGATLPPPMLSVCGITRAEIEDAIRRDVASYLPAGSTVTVTVDLAAMAGQIRGDALPAGTFALRLQTGGAR